MKMDLRGLSCGLLLLCLVLLTSTDPASGGPLPALGKSETLKGEFQRKVLQILQIYFKKSPNLVSLDPRRTFFLSRSDDLLKKFPFKQLPGIVGFTFM
jgi:hypothetical protein